MEEGRERRSRKDPIFHVDGCSNKKYVTWRRQQQCSTAKEACKQRTHEHKLKAVKLDLPSIPHKVNLIPDSNSDIIVSSKSPFLNVNNGTVDNSD